MVSVLEVNQKQIMKEQIKRLIKIHKSSCYVNGLKKLPSHMIKLREDKLEEILADEIVSAIELNKYSIKDLLEKGYITF